MNMGLTAECVQRKYNISREEADAFSYRSHQNALRAQAEGRFDDEIVPFEIEWVTPNGKKPKVTKTVFAKDEGPRADTTAEALAKLKACGSTPAATRCFRISTPRGCADTKSRIAASPALRLGAKRACGARMPGRTTGVWS